MVHNDMCRFCLDSTEEKTFYPMDLEMSILEMGSGSKVTIGDALKYIEMDILIPTNETKLVKSEQSEAEETEEDEANEQAKEDEIDHPDLPKSLCQECLDKLQSIYEFKYRVLENREYLKGYIKELAEARLAEEKAARQAIAEELDIDLNNLDNLPDKLVLKKNVRNVRRPRKPRDPSEPGKPRQKRRAPDRSVIIAEDSQVDTAIYVRKVVITPEKTPEQMHSSKRKSKHVIIEDIAVGEKQRPPKYDRTTRKKEPLCDENNPNENNSGENDTEEDTKVSPKKERRDDEPIFEDDEDFEKETKRPKRPRK